MKGLCVITDENDIVVSISLIPGVGTIPSIYHVYFPAEKNAVMGEEYREESKDKCESCGEPLFCRKCGRKIE